MLTQAVARFQAGDKDAFTEIAECLESDVRAKSRARSNYIPGYDVEDVEQELRLMLEEAAIKFKPSYGVQFRTYFWRLAGTRIANLQRAQMFGNRRAHTTALYCDMDPDIGSYDEEGFTEAEILFDMLSRADVTDRERQIVRLKLEGYSNREVNSFLGGKVYTRSDGAYIRCEVDRILASLKKKVAFVLAS